MLDTNFIYRSQFWTEIAELYVNQSMIHILPPLMASKCLITSYIVQLCIKLTVGQFVIGGGGGVRYGKKVSLLELEKLNVFSKVFRKFVLHFLNLFVPHIRVNRRVNRHYATTCS